jgi:hypothetical protein
MESLNHMLDYLFYGCISPLFQFIGRLLSLVLIKPLAWLQVPVWLHVILLALLTVFFFLLPAPSAQGGGKGTTF